MNIESQKYQLITCITQIESEWMLTEMDIFIKQLMAHSQKWSKVIKPLRKTTTLEELKTIQNYQKPMQKEVDELIKELAIEEPIDLLLSQLSK